MKDVIYAGFAQLSYLNWQNLDESYIGRDITEILKNSEDFSKIATDKYKKWKKTDGYYLRLENGNKIYSAYDSRIFLLYSEDEEDSENNPKFKDFKNWEFLAAYDHKKILDEACWIIDKKDSGFQANAFRNGDNVIIAYRGTDEKRDWIEANLPIGMNMYVDQLTCVAWFYDKIKEMAGGAKIYITGHSLGGCLAQFAYIYSGCVDITKTWNGLGIGEKDKGFKIFSSKSMDIGFLKNTLKRLGYLKGKNWQEKCMDANGKEIADAYIKRYNGNNPEEDPDAYVDLEKKDINKFIIEIEFKLKTLYKFQSNYDKADIGSKLTNIYFKKDLTPNLQKRLGIIIKADKKASEQTIDEGSSGIIRKIDMAVRKSVVKYHFIPNFIPFIDDNGNIEQGILRENYILNSIKTVVQSDKFRAATEKLLRSGEENLPFPIGVDKNVKATNDYRRSSGMSEIPGENIEVKDAMNNMLFKELLRKSLDEYNGKWYCKDGNCSMLGRFTNYEEIGKVEGGNKVTV